MPNDQDEPGKTAGGTPSVNSAEENAMKPVSVFPLAQRLEEFIELPMPAPFARGWRDALRKVRAQRHRRLALSAHAVMESFKRLNSLTRDEKRALARPMRRHVVRCCAALILEDGVVSSAVMTCMILSLGSTIWLLEFLTHEYALASSKGQMAALFPVTVVLGFALWVLVMICFQRFESELSRRRPTLAAFLGRRSGLFLLFICSGGLLATTSRTAASGFLDSGVLRILLTMIAFSTALYSSVFIVSVVAVSLLARPFILRAQSLYPDSLVILRIVEALFFLERPARAAGGLRRRRSAMASLDRAAQIAEGPLRRALRQDDQQSRAWLEQELSQVASAIRECKREIGPTEAQGGINARQAVARLVGLLTTGYWHEVATLYPNATDWRARRRSRVLDALRSGVVALSPAAALAILQASPMAIQLPTFEYAKLGVVAWAVFVIVTAIEPAAVGDATPMKRILSLFH